MKRLLTVAILRALLQMDESSIFHLDVARVNDHSGGLAHLTLTIVLAIFCKDRMNKQLHITSLINTQ